MAKWSAIHKWNLRTLLPLGSRRAVLNAEALVPEYVGAHIIKRRYHVLRKVGAGAGGRVLLAEDVMVPGRQVAIKQVATSDFCDEEIFRHEVELLKKLDHPNICRLLETCDEGSRMSMVMEFCQDGDLHDVVIRRGPLREEVAADIVGQVAGALKFVHGRGIVHRDLKPENICLHSLGRDLYHVKVIDWGLACYSNSADMKETVGSLEYIAPEVETASLSHRRYTSACDMWSLGVTLFFMLTARLPSAKASSKAAQPFSRQAAELTCALVDVRPDRRLAPEAVLAHPWVAGASALLDRAITQRVLSAMFAWAANSVFQLGSVFAAAVARQVDHHSLQDFARVFHELDGNGDGRLDLAELLCGFERAFGKGGVERELVQKLFDILDFDHSKTLDYTEFCAAGMLQQLRCEEEAQRIAFKFFDTGSDGRITKPAVAERLRCLCSGGSIAIGDAQQSQSPEECADRIFAMYDVDKNGTLDFDEWRAMMLAA
mmetsp:Transcript_26946/g.78208  ORF Transcript_26946/g.78208 Transcript_26946/m.78208 type:complete len:488 (-) Transcript_26946:291-1754(-)